MSNLQQANQIVADLTLLTYKLFYLLIGVVSVSVACALFFKLIKGYGIKYIPGRNSAFITAFLGSPWVSPDKANLFQRLLLLLASILSIFLGIFMLSKLFGY